MLDRRALKLKTMNRDCNPEKDISRLFVYRKENERVLVSTEGCIMAAKNYIAWHGSHSTEDIVKMNGYLNRSVYSGLCDKADMERVENWYQHKPDGVIENKGYRILWDMNTQ